MIRPSPWPGRRCSGGLSAFPCASQVTRKASFVGIIGNLDWAFLRAVSRYAFARQRHNLDVRLSASSDDGRMRLTPALITGAFANPRNRQGLLLFLTGWLVLVYFPFVHMVCGQRACRRGWGVLDFAGGIVVHVIAGIAALASIFYVGKRKVLDHQCRSIPNGRARARACSDSVGYGFNAGSGARRQLGDGGRVPEHAPRRLLAPSPGSA